MGKPFVLGARGPDEYDCWGVCIVLAKRVDIILPEHLTPNSNERQEAAIETMKGRFIRLDKPEPFCIATYRMHGSRKFVDHCAFVNEDCSRVIHTLFRQHVHSLRIDNRILLSRLDGYYKYAD